MDEEGVDSGGERLAGLPIPNCVATIQNSRFLQSASLSLRETEAPVGMTSIFLSFEFFPGLTNAKLSRANVLQIEFTSFDFLEGMGVGEFEFCDGGAAQRLEMGSGAETLAHFVGDGTHVGSGSDAGAEGGAVGFD